MNFSFQLDTDGDGKLSFEEFKVLFTNAERRRKKAAAEVQEVIKLTSIETFLMLLYKH